MEPNTNPHPSAPEPDPHGDSQRDPHPLEKGENGSVPPGDPHVSSSQSTKGEDEPVPRDRLHLFRGMAALAGRQHGTVTASQLLDLGLERYDIARAVERGRLHRLHQGVYLVGHTAMAPLAREHAALLACGGAAVLSHRTAAELWNLAPRPPIPEVTVVGRHVRKRTGIRLHQVETIELADVTSRHGLKVTSPARTLIDLAAIAEPDELEAALSEAYALRRVTEAGLHRALERNPGRPGTASLTALLGSLEGPTITKSKAERKLRALIRQAGLPQPVSNARVLRYSPDLLWPEQRLIVEFDGFQWHGHRLKFESDRERDATLVAHGYRVIRITWNQLIQQPYKVLANLARALGPDSRVQH